MGRAEIASAVKVTSSPKFGRIANNVDDALMAPWVATGMIGPQDARLFAAAVASDPELDDDLAAALSEYAAVSAMGEALGRPSLRPLLALFDAIDADRGPIAANVTKLTFACARADFAFEPGAAIDLKRKKFGRRR